MEGKVALIFGATSGIGSATACMLAELGATVIVAGRREVEGQTVVSRIGTRGGRARFVRADVSVEDDVSRVVRDTVARYGRLDAAVNNAGIELSGTITDITEAEYRRVFDINLWGVACSMKHEIRAMLAHGGGNIVNTSSIAGHVGIANFALYNASKHGVEGLTKTAALECAQHNIRVNAVAPAFIATPMVERFVGLEGERREQLAAMHPMHRLGKPDEVAAAIAFLLSGASGFTTGTSLKVDGGWIAQ
ncbi:short chain dehydrogenase [Burkholderia multivorans]|nr:short chain dehydrogenase [Burkholderia multivorans]